MSNQEQPRLTSFTGEHIRTEGIPTTEQLPGIDYATEQDKINALKRIEQLRQEGKEALDILEGVCRERNIFTPDEWAYFAVLFRQSVADTGLTMDDYLKRSREYVKQIDPYSPILIVNPFNRSQVLAEIHSQFRPLVPLSDSNEQLKEFVQVTYYDSPIQREHIDARDGLAYEIIKNQNFETVPMEKVEVAKSIIDIVQKTTGKTVEKITVNDQDSVLPDNDVVPTDNTQVVEIDLFGDN